MEMEAYLEHTPDQPSGTNRCSDVNPELVRIACKLRDRNGYVCSPDNWSEAEVVQFIEQEGFYA